MANKVTQSIQHLHIICADCEKDKYWDELVGVNPDGILICKDCLKKYKEKH